MHFKAQRFKVLKYRFLSYHMELFLSTRPCIPQRQGAEVPNTGILNIKLAAMQAWGY